MASALLCPFASVLHAQVPQLINHQGRVVVSGTNFTGTGQFKFALVSGGSPTVTYWSNDSTSTKGAAPTAAVSLAVVGGLYSVLLGDTTVANMTAISTTVFANPDVRLRTWFNDGIHGWQQLSPDQRIASVGYAMVAKTASYDDLTNKPMLGTAAALNIGTGAGTVAAGDDSRFSEVNAATQAALDNKATAAQGAKANSALTSQPVLKNFQANLTSTGFTRVCLLGDSFAANPGINYLDYFKKTYGIAGYGYGMNYAVLSGGATQSTVDYQRSMTGCVWTIPQGGVAAFGGYNNGGANGMLATTWKLFYIKESGGGTFRIEALNSSGNVTSTTTIEASNSSTVGAVVSGTFAWGVSKLRVSGLTGASHVLGCEMVDTYRNGGVILESLAIGGLAIPYMVTVAQDILSPVLSAAAPDLYIFKMNDPAADISLYLPQVVSKLKAGYGASDFILIGTHSFEAVIGDTDASDAYCTAASQAVQAVATANGFVFVDSLQLFGSLSQILAADLLDSEHIHLTSAGEIASVNAALTQSGVAGMSVTAKWRSSQLSTLNITGENSGNSRFGGSVWVGRDDARGISAGRLWFNDSNASSFVDGDGSYCVENISGVLRISMNTWSQSRGNLKLLNWRNQPAANIQAGAILTFGGTDLNETTLPGILGGTGTPPETLPGGGAANNNMVYFQTDATGPGMFVRQGGQWRLFATLGRKAITGGTYTVTAADHIIAITGKEGATVTLPGGLPEGKEIVIKDEGGAAGMIPIATSGTADGGAANPSINTNYGVLRLYTNGTVWFTQ